MEIAQILDDAISEYYSDKCLPVPNWKTEGSTMVDRLSLKN